MQCNENNKWAGYMEYINVCNKQTVSHKEFSCMINGSI